MSSTARFFPRAAVRKEQLGLHPQTRLGTLVRIHPAVLSTLMRPCYRLFARVTERACHYCFDATPESFVEWPTES
jgi:hypothetical protein